MGGDFNEILLLKEKKGGVASSQKQMESFREALDGSNFANMGYMGDAFTWKRTFEKGRLIKKRLDRFVANPNMISKFNKIDIAHLNYHNSDHRPILASLAQEDTPTRRKKKNSLLRFEESWLAFEE